MTYVIKVYEHKTGPSGEARVVLIQELYEQFKIFLFRSMAEIKKMLNKSGELVKYFSFFVPWKGCHMTSSQVNKSLQIFNQTLHANSI